MLLRLAVSRRGLRGFLMLAAGSMVFMKLPGAIGAVELVALAGNSKQGNGRKKDGE